jgi:hypothetical protein
MRHFPLRLASLGTSPVRTGEVAGRVSGTTEGVA